MRKISFLVSVMFLMMLFVLPGNINAQVGTEKGLIVSPPYFEKDLQAGETYTQEFVVINQRDEREDILVYLKEQSDFGITEAGGLNILDFLTIEPTNLSLQPGEKTTVTITISPPEILRTAGYYAEIGFRVVNQGADVTLGVAPEVAIPLISNIEGVGNGSIDLTVFNFDHLFVDFNFLYEYLPVTFSTNLQNVGDYHVQPRGQIFISNSPEFKSEQLLATLDFNPSNQTLFAGSTRSFENAWEDGFFVLNNEDRLELKFGEKAQFGKYYAQLNIIWDVQGRSRFLTSQTEFWIIPWKIILAGTVTVISLVASRVLYLRYQLEPSGNRRGRKRRL